MFPPATPALFNIYGWPNGNGMAKMNEKEDFWLSLRAPIERRCGNCVFKNPNFEKNADSLRDDGRYFYTCSLMSNDISYDDFECNGDWKKRKAIADESERWLKLWKWDGENE